MATPFFLDVATLNLMPSSDCSQIGPAVRHLAPPTSPYFRGLCTEQAELVRVVGWIRCAGGTGKTIAHRHFAASRGLPNAFRRIVVVLPPAGIPSMS
jgi:hypothetical protein